jgi:UDP-N-acetylglucosamine 2-epimerase (non-hydrolysing)
MIDTLLSNQNRFQAPPLWESMNLTPKNYFVMTLHRPANVDEGHKLNALIHEIVVNVNGLPILFPIHPRTAKIFADLGIAYPNLHIVEPLGYLQFNYLVKHSKAVITDSGGITEETTVMGVPCITLRENTERPETVEIGTNVLVGTNPEAIKPALDTLFRGDWKEGRVPELWDGNAASRIVKEIIRILA